MVELEEKQKLKGFKNLKKYLRYFQNYRFLCFMFWLLLVLSAVISFFSPMVLGKVIASMTADTNFPLAWKFALVFFGLEVIQILLGMSRVPFFKKLENYVKRDVKLDVLKNSFNINIGEYENLGNGLFVTRLTTDLDSLATSFKQISETAEDKNNEFA